MFRSRPARSRPPRLEQLEDRALPTTFGLPWSDPGRLSLSFAPAGTAVDGQTSSLAATFPGLAADAWKTEILRAFQTWAVHGNINIGVVADGGQAFGVPGAVQGDSRFGDIRIGARAYDVHLATNSPFGVLSDTRAGDLLFNTGAAFGIGGATGYDIYSVTLHEAGNILGLQDNDSPGSPLYRYYNGVWTGLTAGDIAGVQALYGARAADDFEGAAGNNSFANATVIGTTAVVADVTSLADVDYYRVTAPLDLAGNTLTVRVKAAEVSLLTPALTVYNANYAAVATATSTDPLDNTVLVELQGVAPGAQYYIKVAPARQDVFGIGGYRLRVFPGAASQMGNGVANNDFNNGALQDDNHTNDVLASATALTKPAFLADTRFDARVVGKVRNAADVDFYTFTAPTPAGIGVSQTITLMAWGLEQSRFDPRLTVYDQAGNAVAADVVVNDAGTFVVQVQNAAAGAAYYVKVSADNPAANYTGNYLLGIDFNDSPAVLDSAGGASLDAGSLQAWRSLDNTAGQVFHFVLNSQAAANTGVRMTVYDSMNTAVFSLISLEGSTSSTNVYLASGSYTIRFEGGTRNGAPMSSLSYSLRLINVTDPIDPMPVDPLSQPSGAPTFTTGSTPGSTISILEQADPYSNPWTGG